MVDTDRITGAAKELGGKVQGAVGDLTASQRDSVEGRARQAAGQAENLYGQAKDTVRDPKAYLKKPEIPTRKRDEDIPILRVHVTQQRRHRRKYVHTPVVA